MTKKKKNLFFLKFCIHFIQANNLKPIIIKTNNNKIVCNRQEIMVEHKMR